MNENNLSLLGRYRHYKGNDYTVVGIAKHSETLEEYVVYRPEYGEAGLWIRPISMFFETVTVDGESRPRFAKQELADSPVELKGNNFFENLPQNFPQEVIQTLIQARDIRIERIISYGHSSPVDFWYNQSEQEWVIVLKGAARLEFEEGMIEMKVGDYLHIPAFKKHRVDWTSPDEPTIWLGVFFS
jgi:cupin 2 domain-containing protein